MRQIVLSYTWIKNSCQDPGCIKRDPIKPDFLYVYCFCVYKILEKLASPFSQTENSHMIGPLGGRSLTEHGGTLLAIFLDSRAEKFHMSHFHMKFSYELF